MTDVKNLAKLREPLPKESISKLPKPYSRDAKKGKCDECGGYHGLPAAHLDYAGHAAITDRLLDVDLEWNWEPFALDDAGLPKFDANGGLWILLTVDGVTRRGYGDAQGKTGPNAVKEAIGDAIRNAAMRFGAGLELWHKDALPEPTPDYEDPGPYADQITAATSVEELTTLAGRIASATLLRGDRSNLRAAYSARLAELKEAS